MASMDDRIASERSGRVRGRRPWYTARGCDTVARMEPGGVTGPVRERNNLVPLAHRRVSDQRHDGPVINANPHKRAFIEIEVTR